MNILYISHLTNNIAQGPNYSVPAQIAAQAEYDNVFWWNLTDACQQHWLDTGLFHGIKEYPKKKISALPEPFNQPDLVVFESFYYIDDVLLSLECRKRKIPYVIIPRSALTRQGQAQKRLKKTVANFLLFKPMTRHALSVQYLTEQERVDSGSKWCASSFIMPNGIYPAKARKVFEKTDALNGICIGRFDPYQKGLDLLLEACDSCSAALREAKLTVTLYGPERMGCREAFANQVSERGLGDILLIKDGIFGEEKAKILQQADFFIMTSRFEGMPMSLIEAMSYGLPCFVSQGTNMRAEVEKNDAGWGCDATVEGIIQALRKLLTDRENLQQIGQNAYALSLRYNWNEIGRKTHAVYQDLLK